ncbi:hypothetical protein GA0061103_2438 [Rhizobium multihospitium]|uniref:Uncharacterized protein n=1 Tax=Rhizobium multihospitium TaxID=410764 RepID=A0A1C3UPZ9_9HYPH|nr:hypothetical protein GA0061103_2438 [Rhizobium multihospitium]
MPQTALTLLYLKQIVSSADVFSLTHRNIFRHVLRRKVGANRIKVA